MRIHIAKWPTVLKWAIGGLILFLAVFGIVYGFFSSQPQYINFESKQAGISLQYDMRLQQQAINEADQKDGVILRLQHDNNQPEILITLRHEDGLKPIATATKQELRSALIDTVNKTYPKRFPDYRQVSSKELEIDGHKAFELEFTYRGSTKETVKQRFVLVVIDDDKAAYLAMQSKESDFNKASPRYFDPIMASLRLN